LLRSTNYEILLRETTGLISNVSASVQTTLTAEVYPTGLFLLEEQTAAMTMM
jgi:hypothetical protein